MTETKYKMKAQSPGKTKISEDKVNLIGNDWASDLSFQRIPETAGGIKMIQNQTLDGNVSRINHQFAS